MIVDPVAFEKTLNDPAQIARLKDLVSDATL